MKCDQYTANVKSPLSSPREGSLDYALAKLKTLGLLASGLAPEVVYATPGTLRSRQLYAENPCATPQPSSQEKIERPGPSPALPNSGPLAYLAKLAESRRENDLEASERRKALLHNLDLGTQRDWVPLASHPGLALHGEPSRPRERSGRFAQRRLGLRRLRPSVKNPRLTEKVRHWAGRGIIPEWQRKYFTPYQAGVGAYILDHVKRVGECKEFNAGIAYAMDVSTKTVQRTIAVLESLGYQIRRGRFNARTGKNEPTSISVTCSNVWNWIKRNAPGLKRPSKGNIETSFWRPCPTEAEKSRGVVDNYPDSDASLCLDST